MNINTTHESRYLPSLVLYIRNLPPSNIKPNASRSSVDYYSQIVISTWEVNRKVTFSSRKSRSELLKLQVTSDSRNYSFSEFIAPQRSLSTIGATANLFVIL